MGSVRGGRAWEGAVTPIVFIWALQVGGAFDARPRPRAAS